MTQQADCNRLSARHAVLLQARCRKSTWNVFPVELADISQGGCCMVGGNGALAPGDAVQLRIANMKPIEGEVRWLASARIGVEFGAPLSMRAAEEIARIYSITTPREMVTITET